MGASVVSALAARCDVVAVRAGRREATLTRATDAGASLVVDLAEGLDGTDLVVSVCPPAAAVSVAEEVAAHGYRGRYLDANAVSPATVASVAAALGADGDDGPSVTDGGIIGPPGWRPGTTRLVLSGGDAGEVAELFAGSPFETVVVGDEIGAASALKLAYAAWTKGSSALLMAVAAFAEREGVMSELRDEWERSQPGLANRLAGSAVGTAPKAWRFVGEMEEIAAAFERHDLPTGFHRGAADLYEMLAVFRDEAPSFGEVAELLSGRRS